MKPSNAKQLRQKRMATSALKREIHARYGWLSGAPLGDPGAGICEDEGIPWLLFEAGHRFAPHRTVVSREDLERAIRGAAHLRHAFPRAFPKLVGDVDQWIDRHLFVPRILRAGGGIVDTLEWLPRGSRAVAEAVQRIAGDFPSLLPLLRSLLWRLPHQETAVRADLRLLEKISAPLAGLVPVIAEALAEAEEETVGEGEHLIVQLQILHLAGMVSPAAALPLFEMIHHPAAEAPSCMKEAIPFGKLLEFTTGKKRGKKARRARFPVGPCPPMSRRLIGFARQLSEMEKAPARQCLDIFLLVHPTKLQENLAKAWQMWTELRPFLERFYRHAEHFDRAERDQLAQRIRRIEAASEEVPLADGEVVEFQDLPIAPALRRAIRRLLQATPRTVEGCACRLFFLRHFVRRYSERNAKRDRSVALVVDKMALHFRRKSLKTRRDFAPWDKIASGQYSYDRPELDVVEQISDPEKTTIYFEALTLLMAKKNLPRDCLTALPLLVARFGESERAIRYCMALGKEGIDEDFCHNSRWLSAALSIDANGDAESFAPLLKAVLKLDCEIDYDLEKPAVEILKQLAAAGETSRVKQLLAEKKFRRILYLSRLAWCCDGAVAELPEVQPTRGRTPGWMQRYPSVFTADLKRLRRFLDTDETRKRAESILGKNFPDPKRLRTERAHLEQKLGAAKAAGQENLEPLRLRIRKLQQWIDAPTPLSPARMENLRNKLHDSVGQCRFDEWSATLREQACYRLTKKLPGFPAIEEWIEDPERLRHVIGVLGLDARERRHPLWVLQQMQEKASASVLDFCDLPANRKFVTMLESKGLDLSSWINGEVFGRRSFTLEDGNSLHLEMENNVLEILDMGHHFDTCLSPMGCNYFSVYANISDVNKRVVYGRGSDGKVRARCLLALGDEGTLLVFHPYSHDSGEQFRKIITEFAEELAAVLGTIVTPRGTVRALVGPDWYDDGSIDVGTRFAFLRDGSPFRSRLSRIEPEKLRGLLFEEISRFDALTIPYVIYLDEIRERPELIVPLLPEILDHEAQLASRTMMRVASYANRAGETDAARQITERHAHRLLMRAAHVENHWHTLWLLVEHRPTLALDVLRRRRPKGARTWEKRSGQCILAAAECYYALHRRKQAGRLYGLLKPNEFDTDWKEFIRERRRELERDA